MENKVYLNYSTGFFNDFHQLVPAPLSERNLHSVGGLRKPAPLATIILITDVLRPT